MDWGEPPPDEDELQEDGPDVGEDFRDDDELSS